MQKWAPSLALAVCAACSSPTAPKKAETQVLPAKITQFYAVNPKLAPGEEVQLCYGVENATSVWLSPPRQDLPTALTRCFKATPSGASTTYQLTAQGADGKSVSQDVTVTLGPPRVHISEVEVSTLDAAVGDVVSVCYTVVNAASVKIDPIRFKGPTGHHCATDRAKKTITYVVTATGADGETDSEKITVKVH